MTSKVVGSLIGSIDNSKINEESKVIVSKSSNPSIPKTCKADKVLLISVFAMYSVPETSVITSSLFKSKDGKTSDSPSLCSII